MYNTRIVELLRSFTPYELNRFGKFVHSPFFNMNTSVTALFVILKDNYPDLKSTVLEREKVFVKIYPGLKYNDKKIRDLAYELLRLGEKFLGVCVTIDDKTSFGFEELDGLIKKSQNKLVEKKIKDIHSALDSSQLSNTMLFYKKYFLSRRENYFNIFSGGKNAKDIMSNYIQSGESAILFMIEVIMSTVHNLVIRSSSYNEAVTYNLVHEFVNNMNLAEIVENAGKHNHPGYFYLRMNYLNIMVWTDLKNTYYYYELKKDLALFHQKLRRLNFYDLLMSLKSYCVEKYLAGAKEFVAEEFELTKALVEFDLITPYPMDHIPYGNFHAIFSSAIKARSFEWARSFAEKYYTELLPELRLSSELYCSAVLSFYNGDYDDALNNFSRLVTDDIFLKVGSKEMTLKIFYERSQHEAAFDFIDSFRPFIRKNKQLTKTRRQNVLKFIDAVYMLINISINKKQKDDIAHLKEEILKSPNTSNSTWLLEKIEEMNK